MTEIAVEEVETFWASLYIAGDVRLAKQVCREECMRRGLCVTVSATSYIYTGGEESGVVIGFINYSRFPADPNEIYSRAQELGHVLMERLCQRSFTIVTPRRSIRYSREASRSSP